MPTHGGQHYGQSTQCKTLFLLILSPVCVILKVEGQRKNWRREQCTTVCLDHLFAMYLKRV